MKVMTILGSPKKKGNTAEVLSLFENIIAEKHKVDRVNIASIEVKGCLGCGACQTVKDVPGCVQKDDAVGVFEHMIDADVVLYSSPLYCWSFSSQIKALIDRHYCLVTGAGTSGYKSLFEGKRTALLVTCGGPVENNADLIQEIFDRMNQYLHSNVVGKYIIPFCTTPDEIESRGLETAKKMAMDIEGNSF